MNINFLDVIDLSLGKDGGIIENCIRALVYLICDFIYSLIISVYSIFERLCNARILDGEILETIAERVGIVLGIIMLFMVVFSVIQMILEPDKLTDKEKGIGNIAKKIILVVVMLGVSGATFRMLYGLQTNLIKSNIVQKFLLPYEISEDIDFGGVLSANLFTSFYTFNTNGLDMTSTHNWDPDDIRCYNQYAQLQKNIKNNEGFHAGRSCVNMIRDNGEHIMSFNWLLSPLVGGVVLYFIFTYCITVGVGSIQLAFLEIISSMAIISYLSPKKDNMFQKWIKLYFATYVDVFLRIMIINLVAFLILIIFENVDEQIFWDSVGRANDFSDTVILVLIILALLTFAKKAPDLIKDLFPSSASKLGLGMTSPKKLFDGMLGGKQIESGLKRTAGLGIGAVIGGAGNFARAMVAKDKNGNPLNWKDKLSTAAGGMWSGAKAGFGAKDVTKSFGASNKAALDQSKRLAEWRANGGVSGWTRWKTGMQQQFGLQTESDFFEQDKIKLDKENELYNQLTSSFKSVKERAKSKIAEGAFDTNTNVIESKTAQNKIEMLKTRAGNLKLSDFGGSQTALDAEMDRINDEIIKLNKKATDFLDKAVEDYYNGVKYGTLNDAVISGEIAKTDDLLKGNRKLSGFSGSNITTFAEFKAADGKASSARNKNDIELAQNKREGEAARADAKYNPKSGK